ncbi:MAG: DEAD/DEAH box helicase [Methanolinea sp.]|nr:DEAD/DEAH box helicase [Methanolinea sp.]
MNGIFSGLHESLQEVLAHRLGWSDLREVQSRAYREVSAGKDVLVIAPTAGGKTEAALIPVLDLILKQGSQGVACIYLSPLKALINDQEVRFRSFSVPTGLEVRMWHGDVPRGDRTWEDGEPPHLLMITPESLEVLMGEHIQSRDLCNARFVIVDELHAFVESERGVHLRVLLDRLDAMAGHHVQRIGLSATVGNPEEVLAWLSGKGHEKELVQVAIPPREKRFSFHLEEDERRRMKSIAKIVAGKKALVFVNSRAEAEQVGRALRGRVAHLFVHHSSLSPEMRCAAEESIAGEASACIICTSTLELGIDIGDLDVVVQLGAPASVSSFLQRMGRSGRRGRSPYMAFVLVDAWDLLLCTAVIESASRKRVEPLTPVKRPYNVLVQQVFLELVRHRRTTLTRLRRYLGALPSFQDLPDSTLDLLLTFLEEKKFLVRDGEMFMPGPEMEVLYGRSNWKDLYSVIRGGGEFRAVTPEGDLVGRLDARFVASGGQGSFSLGGKNWTLIKSDESHNLVVVVPGDEAGGKAFWTGGQAGFSPVVCQAVLRILSRRRTLLPLLPPQEEALQGVIESMPPLHTRGVHIWEVPGKRKMDVMALTFLSRPDNALLSAMVRRVIGAKTRIRYDDLSLWFPDLAPEGAAERIISIFRQIQALSVREMTDLVTMPLPETWKFGPALPPALIREMAAADTWHIEEFAAWFSGLPLYLVPAPGRKNNS